MRITRRSAIKRLACAGGALVAGSQAFKCAGQRQPSTACDYHRQWDGRTGITYDDLTPANYSQPDSDLVRRRIRATGANWLAIVDSWFQDGIDMTTVGPSQLVTGENEDYTLADDDLRQVIRVAFRLGFQVLLKPHLDLTRRYVDKNRSA